MPTHINIELSPAIPLWEQSFEIVERKGKGHPDTICDAIADRISVELSGAYEDRFGRILHHNVDKCLLVAGQVDCHLGGGRVKEPMRLIIGDRASWGEGKRRISVKEIAIETAKNWFTRNLPHLDPIRHVNYQVELKPVSPELGAIFERRGGLLPANDTSAAVGYAPLTPTEQTVLGLEHYLNSPTFKEEFPQTGEDIKVMGVRLRRDLSLTIAMPFLAKPIRTEKTYFQLKTQVVKNIRDFLKNHPQSGAYRATITLNALDRPGQGIKGMYLSLLGTSAEHGDSGQVGRGNRVCGVVALNRPMSGEAAAGKNPVSHVGKIYNVFAHELAQRLYKQVSGLNEVIVWLSSTIGQRVDRPKVVVIHVALVKGASLPKVKKEINRLVQNELSNMGQFCEDLAHGKYSLY